jgi:hypothetical protein
MSGARADFFDPRTVLFTNVLFGVNGAFLDADIRGIPGDEDPWTDPISDVRLHADGRLHVFVDHLVEEDGVNPSPNLRAIVSCLSDDGHGHVTTVNVPSAPFSASRRGRALTDQRLALPKPCVAPIIRITNGGGNVWFASTGVSH